MRQNEIHLSGKSVLVFIILILATGCASSPDKPSSSPAQSSVFPIEQPPMTSYMRSQVGTPNELSPIAPAEARNVRIIGNQWLCDFNGQLLVYNDASANQSTKTDEMASDSEFRQK